MYNPALPSYSDNLRISYSTSQNAFDHGNSIDQIFHANVFYNAIGIDVPVKDIGTFSLVRNYNHIIDSGEGYPGDFETKYTSYNINYARDLFNGLRAGAGLNYFKWDGLFPSGYWRRGFFSEYYSLNLGVSYSYNLPRSEYYSQSAFVDISVLNVLSSHQNTRNDFSDLPSPLPQKDNFSLGYLSKYKGFGIIKGMDDFQTDVQIEAADLLNSYYYNTFKIGAEIKFIEIISFRVGNYVFNEDYMTYGLGLSFPFKLVSEIPLVIGFDYSHFKASLFIDEGYINFNSFSVNAKYDLY